MEKKLKRNFLEKIIIILCCFFDEDEKYLVISEVKRERNRRYNGLMRKEMMI